MRRPASRPVTHRGIRGTSIGLRSGSTALSNEKPMNEDLAQRILGAMNKKAYTGEQTVRWLANLNEDLPVNPDKKTAASSELSVRSITILDRLFDDFQRYCFEFNKTVTDREFRVQCERPKPVNLKMPYREEPIICQGHLSTTIWSMIVQAQESTVNVFIVPMDFLLGFHDQRNEFQPHMTMRAIKNSLGGLAWQIDGIPVQTNMLPTISKKLFAALIRVFGGESQYTDKFVMVQQAISTTTQEMMARPAGYQDQGFELLKPSMPPNMALGQQVRDQQAALEAAKNAAATAAAAQASHAQYAQSQHAPPAPPQPQQHAAAPAPSAGMGAPPAPRPPAGNQEEALTNSATAVQHAIDTFNRVLEREMEEMTSASVKAMQNQDIGFVQRTIKRTAALKKFRDTAAGFMGEWQAALKD